MKFSKILIVTLTSLFAASHAFASSTWTVTATTGDGSPLEAVTPGTTLTLAIKLETSAAGEMIATAGSVNDYDTTVVTLDAGASTVPAELLFAAIYPSVGSFNGVTNLESTVNDTSIQCSGTPGSGREDTFLSVLGTSGAGGDGTAESAQFQIVYDVNALPAMVDTLSTVLRVGTFADCADAYSGASDNIVNNAQVAITVPEPTSVAASLAGLASVFGVVAVRRRSA